MKSLQKIKKISQQNRNFFSLNSMEWVNLKLNCSWRLVDDWVRGPVVPIKWGNCIFSFSDSICVNGEKISLSDVARCKSSKMMTLGTSPLWPVDSNSATLLRNCRASLQPAASILQDHNDCIFVHRKFFVIFYLLEGANSCGAPTILADTELS